LTAVCIAPRPHHSCRSFILYLDRRIHSSAICFGAPLQLGVAEIHI
jgi:hypothetical protein